MKRTINLNSSEIGFVSGGFSLVETGGWVGRIAAAYGGIELCKFALSRDGFTPEGYEFIKYVYCALILFVVTPVGEAIGSKFAELYREAEDNSRNARRDRKEF